MPKVQVSSFGISLDGYCAGTDQDLEHPVGVNGLELLAWQIATRTFQQEHGREGGSINIDDEWVRRGNANVGAYIMGRNMFGPVRGSWPDDSWKGWWGDEPPYHVPVFVLTHYPRPSVPMRGGTTFHFVTDGIESALRRAREAAGAKDVRIGGGVSTVRQYLRAGLVDELHLAQSTAVLGRGERLFDDLDARALGFHCVERISGSAATHIVLARDSVARTR